jgi:DNA polymerase elongation subunit (family B)
MSIHHKTALDRDSKDSFIKSSISSLQPMPLEILIKYHDNGFKILPIGNDCKTPIVRSTNEVYDNPDYWTAETLKLEHQRFTNLATTFGKIHLKDENGEALYLHGLDIDSDNVLRILFDLLEELKSKTFVTKTKKDCGYHIYWLSRKQNTPIGTSKCRSGYEFEIKSDNSLGLCALPPSRHRDDPNFRYQCVGQENQIVIDDYLYDKLMSLLAKDCLIQSNLANKSDNHDYNGEPAKSNSIYRILQEDQIEQIVSYIKTSYQKGYRHDLIFGLSGFCFKNKISLPSARSIISLLCDYTHDEEKDSRLVTLSDTYSKGLNGQEIKGATQLQEVLFRIHGETEIADEILGKISRALLADDSFNTSDDDIHPSSTQILVRLARENAVLLFKDQYGVAYGKFRVSGHTEILALESTKFEYYLSKKYYDFTGGEIVGQESLNNAKRVLIAETLFEGPTRELNLRVAWGERKGEDICYDLADPEWQCIRITKEGWQIIALDSPALFTRFNQKPQVLSDRNYPDRIFDDFLDLMHIQDPGHRLLTKVWITSLFIPEFPHPIGITYGEKGGSKSTFCRFVKRLVDPDKIELLTTPQEKAEFVQQLHHNYLAVYDNIKQLPPWFSDEACKAITGVGSSKRRLYSDDEDIIYDYKRCLMISGINNSLTEPDALDRSILTQFDRILDEQRKEESEIETIFEEMRPKLFGYILDMLVKTLQIKLSIKLSNLPRMADFTVWGEAVARAMGYQPMEFVNAYYDNIGKQNVEAIESNPVALAVEKFVSSWFKDGQETCWQSPTSKVLEKLNKVALAHGIDTGSKFWPKAANSLTKRLRPILSNLREGLGIHVVISRNTTGKNKNTSTIRIWKQPPLPPPSPPGQNQAQNEGNIGGGSLESGDRSSTRQEVSPPKACEIQAQKSESGGSGGSGGSITTFQEGVVCSNPLLSDYVAFDFEWSSSPVESGNSNVQIIAAAFVDSHGKSKVLHISDFTNADDSEHELLVAINQELIKYNVSVCWYSTGVAKYHEDTQEYLEGVDSDLAILHNRCLANGVDSIVDFSNSGIPYIRGQKHIDLHSVFGKPMVQTTIFKNSYRTLKLDEVSKAILSDNIDSRKYKGLTGTDFQTLPVGEQNKYVLKDAELVMRLSKHNNGEVLDAMEAISKLTGLDLEKVCRTGLSTWWAAIFDIMVSNGEGVDPVLSINRRQHGLTEIGYVGGSVLQPRKGLYHNLIVVDVASLYPTMAVLHNISFDTVNCQCCEDNSESRVRPDITKDCKIEKEYWICKQEEGAFPKKLRIFKEERLKQKKLGSNIKQLALKILINGGYGVFGNPYFKYYDPRVAELVTAYGRDILSRMQEIATNMGFEVVYGDTDSLFLNNKVHDNDHETISVFQEACNKQLGIEVEHTKTYQTAVISDKKKHYVGWTGRHGTEPDIVGMEGDKNDRPKWINTVFRQTIYDILANTNPIVNLKRSVSDLESGNINPELLKRSNRLSKYPEEYQNENDRKRKIGLAINARKGDIIEYFESDNKEGYSLIPQEISIKKYKVMLWKAVKNIVEIAGYDVAEIDQELITNLKDDHTAKPPRGVVGLRQFAYKGGETA